MASRIQKSIMNAKVNVMFYVITTLLAFFSRKYFLKNLGDDFVGLSSTLGDILNLMNITELGIGTAVGVTLFKPLYDDDKKKINDIISVYGFLYTRVGALIALAGVIVSGFFPLIFKDAGVPLYLPYLMFFTMLYGALLGYFVNFKQIILSASQQNYVIILRYNTSVVIKVILQILTSFLPYNYLWWIALEAITISIYTLIINRTIKKKYPWLQASYRVGKERFKDYKELWTKTKQVFCLKISHVVFNSSTNMLIYAFANLSTVALYGNYSMLMSKITSFIDGLFTGMEASIGNLIAEGDIVKIKKIFNELLCFRYYLAGLCSITLYYVVSPFIQVWLGKEYIMSQMLVILLSLHIFIQQARLTVDNFKNGYGLFQDYLAPIIEVVMNIGLALVLGKLYGMIGILFALVFCEALVKMLWKPYFLFSRGFKQSVITHYWPLIIKYFAIFAVVFAASYFIRPRIMLLFPIDGWLNMLLYCIAMGAFVCIVNTVAFFAVDANFRMFIEHLLSYRRK
jgi:O-antigen/teichoic acid export membrane protein